jgi:multiple sugar transport system permease protein
MNMKKIAKVVLINLIIGFFCFLAILPLAWTVITSIRPPAELFSEPFSFRFTPTLINYQSALRGTPFLRFFMNSAIVAISASLASLLITMPAAYSCARFGTGGQRFKQWVLSVWFLPPIVIAIPFYLAARSAGLIDTPMALIILYLTIGIPLAFLLLTSFISDVPQEIEESALVDGCSRFGAFLKITLPLCLAGVLVTLAFCFIFSWNEYFYALLLTDVRAKTLPVHITSYLSIHSIGWGEAAAAGMIITVPTLVLLVVIQRHLVRGLTFGISK